MRCETLNTALRVLVVTLLSAPVAAGVRVELLGVDGRTVGGELLKAGADDVTVRVGDASTTHRYDDLMLIEFTGAKDPPTTTETLQPIYLADGGRLRGRIVGSGPNGVEIEAPALGGQRMLSFSSLAGIRIATDAHLAAEHVFREQLAAREPGHDVVILVKNNQVHSFRGSVDAIGPDGGRFTRAGRELRLSRETLYGLVFAASPGRSERGPMTLELTTGESMTGRLVEGDASAFRFALPGGEPVALAWDRVRRITIRSERVAWLSDLEPSANEHVPYLNVAWPMRNDRSVANTPLRLGGKTYAKGIGVHSASRVSYELGGRYKQFAAVIGIDDAVRPRGHAVFRVQADGKEVFNSGNVTGRDEPKRILVPIAGARELRLVVDFGEEGDLSDHADWANARVIK